MLAIASFLIHYRQALQSSTKYWRSALLRGLQAIQSTERIQNQSQQEQSGNKASVSGRLLFQMLQCSEFINLQRSARLGGIVLQCSKFVDHRLGTRFESVGIIGRMRKECLSFPMNNGGTVQRLARLFASFLRGAFHAAHREPEEILGNLPGPDGEVTPRRQH